MLKISELLNFKETSLGRLTRSATSFTKHKLARILPRIPRVFSLSWLSYYFVSIDEGQASCPLSNIVYFLFLILMHISLIGHLSNTWCQLMQLIPQIQHKSTSLTDHLQLSPHRYTSIYFPVYISTIYTNKKLIDTHKIWLHITHSDKNHGEVSWWNWTLQP